MSGLERDRVSVDQVRRAILELRTRGVLGKMGVPVPVIKVERTGNKTFKAVLEDAVKRSFKNG